MTDSHRSTRADRFDFSGNFKEIPVRQGSREWLDLRLSFRMASETPAVMGLSPYQTIAQVRAAKLGAKGFVSAAMRKGVRQEPIARAAYQTSFGKVRPVFLVADAYGCSLDGINDDASRILEIKTPYRGRDSERWRNAVKGKVTEYDFAQVQHQLMVSGAPLAHLWVWDADSRTGIAVEVLPEKAFWMRIVDAWDAFWPTLAPEPSR
jgi:putative phage-type endonuclease